MILAKRAWQHRGRSSTSNCEHSTSIRVIWIFLAFCSLPSSTHIVWRRCAFFQSIVAQMWRGKKYARPVFQNTIWWSLVVGIEGARATGRMGTSEMWIDTMPCTLVSGVREYVFFFSGLLLSLNRTQEETAITICQYLELMQLQHKAWAWARHIGYRLSNVCRNNALSNEKVAIQFYDTDDDGISGNEPTQLNIWTHRVLHCFTFHTWSLPALRLRAFFGRVTMTPKKEENKEIQNEHLRRLLLNFFLSFFLEFFVLLLVFRSHRHPR